ncbi:DUF6132 family protein [Maribacter chungangensis]|uniref:DUF6132 family protein n=1 Tax=Maribacter chungangensis TaxID=1069117 RepID=A0ABW3B2Q2_9FLAO
MNRKIILLTVLGTIIGALGGYIYYVEIGCLSGTCPITSKPLNSAMYGGIMGGLVGSMFVPSSKK